jgi:hypothetical protein
MKKFIKRLLLFLTIIIGFVFIDVCLQKTLLFRDEYMKLAKNIHTLFLGHSHTANSCNTEYIKNSINLASAGEAYIYTYFKAKKVIETNPQIKKIYVEFTNNQIDKHMDNSIWDDTHLQYNFISYGVLMDYDALSLLYKKNPSGFVTAFSKGLFNNLLKMVPSKKRKIQYGSMGGFKTNNQIFINSKVTKNKKMTSSNYEISESNIYYLEQIVKYCKQRKIVVILVRSPMHKTYDVSFSENEYNKILSKKFKDIKFIDNKDFPIPYNGFHDIEHLNSTGAKFYSQYFNKLVNENN